MEPLGPGETLDGGTSEKPPEPKTLGGAAEERQGDELGLGLGLGVAPEVNAAAPAEGSPFAAGDLVWGKVKSQPWWPGQVIDPSRASDQAVSARRRGGASVLVSFFGDEGNFAWCQPSQVKPFFSEDLGEMARQSRSKGFITSIEEALGFISRCLESDLTCNCVPPEGRSMGAVSRSEKLGFVNFPPTEFLDCVRNVALDVLFADMIESASLRGWVAALGKGWCGGSVGYHERRSISELVDKFDLDVPAGDLIDGKDELCKSGKKRSMAALIAEMDLDTVEVSDAEEVKVDENVEAEEKKNNKENKKKKKKKKKSNGIGLDIGSFKNEEESVSGSGRRERKKSKYLSPPYTDTKDLKIAEGKKPKNCTDVTQALLSDSASILKCNSEIVQKEENAKSLPLKMDGISASEIFWELICTAQSSSHLKRNRSAKIVRGFFATYRSSMYVKGTGYEAYQKHVKESFCGIQQSSVKEVADNPDVRKSEGNGNKEGGADGETRIGMCLTPASINSSKQKKARQKRKEAEGRSGGETLAGTCLSPVSINPSEQKKAKQKRKKAEGGNGKDTKKGLATNLVNHSVEKEPAQQSKVDEGKDKAEAPTNVDLHSVNIPVESNSTSVSKKNNDDANGETTENSVKEPIGLHESAKASLENLKSKEVANVNNPIVMDREPKDHHQEGKSKGQQKKRKSNSGPTGATLPCTGRKAANGLREGNSRQKRKKDLGIYGNPAALLLNFNPGVVLPSKEELVSTFSKYGLLIETETELLQDTGSARLVFAKSADAEAAFNSSDKVGVFGPPFTTYRLRYLPPLKGSSPPTPIPIPKPPLPFIRKSLERMITSLAGTSSPLRKAVSPDGLKPELKENLVGEMQGLLKKVDKMLNGPPAGP